MVGVAAVWICLPNSHRGLLSFHNLHMQDNNMKKCGVGGGV